ncbi:hypothetical protein GCM10009541_22830 [Micromonospora gifhornensis]|uniref:PRC-barrel domain-containing protein n=1 Tax=Micromonospora gifhornensis TaxID=84594 RepID=A0ABQ4IHF0_9ACTN|nr:hypothetical protein [Micromonospora gifhornensis]GIJ17336.1 hypothetical protein Vgi01_40200 [Micromonospora gifhornensis]
MHDLSTDSLVTNDEVESDDGQLGEVSKLVLAEGPDGTMQKVGWDEW